MPTTPSPDRVQRLVDQLRQLEPLSQLGDAALRQVAEQLAAGGETDHLAAVVDRNFPSASGDIAKRHYATVRLERYQRLVAGLLEALGGPRATFGDLLAAAGRAVTDPVAESLAGIPAAEIRRRLDALKGRSVNAADIEEIKSLVERKAAAKAPDSIAIAQIAQAASQAVQQAAFNVQKILTVALEAERAADAENPKYYYP